MKKSNYTVLTIILSLAFSFGSMAGMHLILKTRERAILSESGKIQTAEPVKESQIQDPSPDISVVVQSCLSERATEQMESVIRCWNSDTDRYLETFTHIPDDEEISMEEAIAIGNEWLLAMNLEQKNDSVYAILGSMPSAYSGSYSPALYDKTFSLWKLQFESSSMRIILYIHAIEGKVWKADITLFRDLYSASLSADALKRFAELAGVKPSGEAAVNAEHTQAILEITDSPITAQVDFLHLQTDPRSGHTATGALDFKAGKLYKENINIVYQFTIDD